jgi:mannose-P-dolichol utilization defect protein 1
VKYFIFREDCYNGFMEGKVLDIPDCLKFTISKALGYAIIGGSAILKLPQIIKILKNGSVHGISKFLFYSEVRIQINE